MVPLDSITITITMIPLDSITTTTTMIPLVQPQLQLPWYH
jgi:hypothetical protein